MPRGLGGFASRSDVCGPSTSHSKFLPFGRSSGIPAVFQALGLQKFTTPSSCTRVGVQTRWRETRERSAIPQTLRTEHKCHWGGAGGPGIPPTLGSAALLAFWLWLSPYSAQASVACSIHRPLPAPDAGLCEGQLGSRFAGGGGGAAFPACAGGTRCWVLGARAAWFSGESPTREVGGGFLLGHRSVETVPSRASCTQ